MEWSPQQDSAIRAAQDWLKEKKGADMPTKKPSPDKKAMLADMKQGIIIDGAHVEQTQSLVIT